MCADLIRYFLHLIDLFITFIYSFLININNVNMHVLEEKRDSGEHVPPPACSSQPNNPGTNSTHNISSSQIVRDIIYCTFDLPPHLPLLI